MKKIAFLFVGVALSIFASAQRTYFLYLQTDDQTPFYVRMADKIYSSAVSGYLILPNLLDSTYNLSVGFPKNTQPETRFAVTINHNDKGYLLKTFHDGISLFDMQTLGLVKAVSATVDNTVYQTRSDNFSSTLSKAANDPSLLKVPVVKKEEPKPEPTAEVVVKKEDSKTLPGKTAEVESKQVDMALPKQETVVIEPTQMKDTAVAKAVEPEVPAKQEPIIKQDPPIEAVVEYKSSRVSRQSESSTTEGLGIVYFDRGQEGVDTIRILIPPSKYNLDDNVPVANLSEVQKREESITAVSGPPKPDVVSQTTTPRIGETSVNQSCKANASEKDFMRLRKNMAAETNDEEMIAEARKSFKDKCYTVEQVRYLSTLFLTSAAKYQFFDATYNHVSDKGNFSSLQSEVKDEYYLKRFKALLGE